MVKVNSGNLRKAEEYLSQTDFDKYIEEKIFTDAKEGFEDKLLSEIIDHKCVVSGQPATCLILREPRIKDSHEVQAFGKGSHLAPRKVLQMEQGYAYTCEAHCEEVARKIAYGSEYVTVIGPLSEEALEEIRNARETRIESTEEDI